MPNVLVKDRQTLFDVAVLKGGDWLAVIDLSLKNNISITKDLKSGDSLIEPTGLDQEIVTELISRSARPASAITADQAFSEGIGYWIIGIDFKVS